MSSKLKKKKCEHHSVSCCPWKMYCTMTRRYGNVDRGSRFNIDGCMRYALVAHVRPECTV